MNPREVMFVDKLESGILVAMSIVFPIWRLLSLAEHPAHAEHTRVHVSDHDAVVERKRITPIIASH